MRLLPRTVPGTWLLAGAVWLGGCGALWWVLPARPRTQGAVPASVGDKRSSFDEPTVVAIQPDRGTAAIMAVIHAWSGSFASGISEEPRDLPSLCGPVRILDLTSGRER